MTPDARPAHRQPRAVALVAVGGALGGMARYAVATLSPVAGGRPALATFVVNIIGAFALGMLLEALTRSDRRTKVHRSTRLLLGTGFCGAFTTYSTFAHDVTAAAGGPLDATAWAAGQVVCGVLAAAGGAWCATIMTAAKR